jgi:hypothetical protein
MHWFGGEMQNPNIKSKRHTMLGKLFIEAQERGIDQQELRDDIVPALIGRRLSSANEKQISLVLNHIAGPVKRRTKDEGRREPTRDASWKRYDSSIAGLKQEITDLAKARWSDAWELPLNNFCLRFGVKRWQWLDVSHGRAVKDVLIRLQNAGATSAMRQPGEEG